MQLSPGWWVDLTLARVWRVLPADPDDAGPANTPALIPTTEFFVTLEAAFGL